jgi:WD40-like Beta Propeller Repeat
MVTSVAMVAVGFVAVAPHAAAASCSGSADKPEIGELMVNQGIPSYGKVIRGKKALIKLFLTLPSSCTSSSSMYVTGATVTLSHVSLDGQTVDPVSLQLTPTATLSGGPLTSPVQDSATWDPIFAVPASFLAPQPNGSVDWTQDWTLRIDASVSYKIGSHGTVTSVQPYLKGSALPATRTVEHKTNAFRVLVVPMGDTEYSYATEFSAAARTAVDNGMSAFARLGPFPDGTNTLNSNANGLRYSVDPGMLNLGPITNGGLGLMAPGGKFCGSASSWSTLQGALTSWLNSYNAANPNFPADRVLGVIDGAISTGSSGSPPCDEGRAAVPTSTTTAVAAWARAVPDTKTAKSLTGPVLSMELMHTVGACVDDGTGRCPGTYHSTSATADVTAPHRGYNVTQASFVANADTVMRLQSTNYDNNNTLFEPDDFALMACILGGDTTRVDGTAVPGCTGTAPGSLGTNSGVPAEGGTFVLSASIDAVNGDNLPCAAPGRIATGTTVYESFFRDLKQADNYPISTNEPTSEYRLLQYSADNTPLANWGLPTSVTSEEHGSGPDDATPPTVIAAAVPFNSATNVIELVHQVSGQPDQVLYCRTRTLAPATPTPSVPETGSKFAYTWDNPIGPASGVFVASGDAVGTGQLCNSAVSCQAFGTQIGTFASLIGGGALSPDGSKVLVGKTSYSTFDSDLELFNSDGSGETNLTNTPSVGEGPAVWASDGHTIAYVRRDNNALIVRDIDTTNTKERVVAMSSAATKPTFSPDGKAIAWIDDSSPSIFAAPSSGTGTAQLLAGGPALDAIVAPDTAAKVDSIAWSPYNDNLIAVSVRGSGGEGAIGLVDVSTGTVIKLGADAPIAIGGLDWTASGTRLMYNQGLGTGDLRELPVDGQEAPQVVFQDSGAFVGEASFATVAAAPDEEITVNDDYPDLTTASLFFTCGNGLQFPIAVGLKPSAITDGTASFGQSFDPSVACGSGDPQIVGYVSDGFSQTPIDTIPATRDPEGVPVPASTPKAPTVAVDAPIDGATYAQTSSFPLHGTGTDAEEGDLCPGVPEAGDQPVCGLSWMLTHNNETVPVASATDSAFVRSDDAGIPASFHDASTGLWDPGDYEITLTGTDHDGNTATASVSITVSQPPPNDTTPPTVTLTGVTNGGSYPSGSVPTPGCSTQDEIGGSGVATPATLSGPTGGNSSGVGVLTVTCSGGTDNAGNTAPPVSATYQVFYASSNNPMVLQPINPDNTSVFSVQRTIPVKFQLDGDPPTGFVTTGWKIQAVSVNCATLDPNGTVNEVGTTNTSTVFVYDPTSDTYQYQANLKTKPVSSCWRFLITLDDGAGSFANTTFYSPAFKLK